MSRLCPNCNQSVPKYVWKNGKKINCQNRRYCFDCSPLGSHNTRVLEVSENTKECPDCLDLHNQRNKRCFRCYFHRRKRRIRQKIEQIVGYSCWICGYDKCKRNIHFHHVNEETKSFGLTARELMLKWDRIWPEMQKCIVLCGNCHGEVHEGIISEEEVKVLHQTRWQIIKEEMGCQASAA